MMDHFADIRDKRMSELTDEQKDRAHEMWLRDQMGGYWPYRDVFDSLLRVIDRLRAQQLSEAAKDTIGKWLAADMDTAVGNGANSVSMPDELVEIAAWLSGVQRVAPSIDYDKLIADCYERTGQAQGTKGCVQFAKGAEWMLEQIGSVQRVAPPIDMILHCPACSVQHIDAPETGWDNPPHRSHLCHGCGHIWRPADVPTNGVAAIKTKGKADSPAPEQRVADDPQHVYALERAVRGLRAVSARLGTPDDPYGGLMHAEDADLLEELLNALRPPLPMVEQPKLCWGQPGYRAVTYADKQTGEVVQIEVTIPFTPNMWTAEEFESHIRQHLVAAGFPFVEPDNTRSIAIKRGRISSTRNHHEQSFIYTWRKSNG